MWRILVIMLILPLHGCYYMQAASGQWEVLRKREPLSEVIAAADTDAILKSRLELLSDARDFSVAVLKLPDNDSYRTYTELSRDYVVWNVFAAPEFSLQPKAWCFPVAGCVNYRGYFKEQAANAEAQRLAAAGFDVYVGGVSAYSTLGKFDDPILSTMLRYDDTQLVATLFHELAHQLIYVKGDTAFNESFATVVEEIGVNRWLSQRRQLDQLTEYRQRRAVSQSIMNRVELARNELDVIYRAQRTTEEKRVAKRVRLQQLASKVATELRSANRDASGWEGVVLDNARLIPLALYQNWVPAFRVLLSACEQDIDCFYAAVRGLAEDAFTVRTVRLERLLQQSKALDSTG